MDLPRTHRYVLETHKFEVIEGDAAVANLPFGIRILLQRFGFHILATWSQVRSVATMRERTHFDEALYSLSHVLRELRPRDGSRGAAEVASWDLPAPGSISGPL